MSDFLLAQKISLLSAKMCVDDLPVKILQKKKSKFSTRFTFCVEKNIFCAITKTSVGEKISSV
jgi:hypothetical protein